LGLFSDKNKDKKGEASGVATGDLGAEERAAQEAQAALDKAEAEKAANGVPAPGEKVKKPRKPRTLKKDKDAEEATIEGDRETLKELFTLPQDTLAEAFSNPRINVDPKKADRIAGATERFLRRKFEGWAERGADITFYVFLAWYLVSEGARIYREIAKKKQEKKADDK